MRSLRRRFEDIKKNNPDSTDYINFKRAVEWQNFTRDMITRWFTRLVPEDEYGRENKKDIINQLVECSKSAEGNVPGDVKVFASDSKNKNSGDDEEDPDEILKGELMCFIGIDETPKW